MKLNIKGQHLQHTSRFKKELNSVQQNKINAFRFYDEVWLIGKYKGTSLNNTPKQYLEWAIKNMKITDTSIAILKNKLVNLE